MSEDHPIVALTADAEDQVAQHWRDRIVTRIAESIDRELREGLPMQAPSSEEQALAIVKGVAGELREAANSLFYAAGVLKACGKAYQASQTHQSGQRALKVAEDLIGA